ncbi:MAG: hypothetical protein M3336_08655 [Chloroflexota bacterium]|nr:hypothetical protein [Chloroflexota bacterium]
MGNGAFPTTVRMLTPTSPEESSSRPYRGQPDWGAARRVLEPLADSSAVLISGSDLKALYYLGRLDVILHATQLYTPIGRSPEFGLSSTVNRPVISTPESVARVMSCVPSGLVIAERSGWRRPWGVPDATADLLEGHAERVPLPSHWQLLAFRWREPRGEGSEACSTLLALWRPRGG